MLSTPSRATTGGGGKPAAGLWKILIRVAFVNAAFTLPVPAVRLPGAIRKVMEVHPLIYENWAALERHRGRQESAERYAGKARRLRGGQPGG